MGKRSNFERVERDFYPTPELAVLPLLPRLRPRTHFVEPCAGDGALILHLQAHGHVNTFASDIEPQADFIGKLDVLNDDVGVFTDDLIITNPPWNRKILHPMIERFLSVAPAWLLFDADWVHTKQSAPYMEFCAEIVSVGRVKWIPDSKMTGKDNCAWYLFDRDMAGRDTVFYGR